MDKKTCIILREKHKGKESVIEINLLHGALLVLERIFQGSKKFIQLSLKPKNPNFSNKYQREDQQI